MLSVLQYLFWLGSCVVMSLRYRLKVVGLEAVRGLPGPTLVLPNHPGYVDPPLVLTALWSALKPRPMVFEGNFKNPILYPIAKLLNAVPVPDLEQASAEARLRAEQALKTVVEGLKRGENHVLWPAGRVERNGVERLGGARAVADILKAVPNAKVVLVRTRGVWGSSFSYAYEAKPPALGSLLLRGALLLLANLLVFMPRRRVTITVELVEAKDLPEARRETLNPWLETWYNADLADEQGRPRPETPTFVPYHFVFGARTYEYPALPETATPDLSRVKPDVKAAVAQILSDKLGRPLADAEQKPDRTMDEFGLDSLDRMEVTLAIEQRFGFASDQTPVTLGQLWALAQGLVERGPTKPPPPEWFRTPPSNGPPTVLGETLAEAFLGRALADPHHIAAADDLSGAITYQRMLLGALLLARRLEKLPSANVGLLLPASVACDTALLALHFAGKLPVVLNWTTGPSSLAHAAKVMQLTHVVTSRAFIDRSGVAVAGVEYLNLEDLRKTIGKAEGVWRLLTLRLFPGGVRRRLPKTSPEQPAVVLFTSGSEKAPKAVPLTHANLLSDQRCAIPALGFTRQDVMLGFLPAFHSFGMNATGLLPLLNGLRVIHHPDPTDAGGLARKIGAYRPTLLVGTPTFVSYILERSQPGELDSLRLIIVGAEKCPAALTARCKIKAPNAELLEGYGVTECAPVVAVNPPGANRPGTIGRAIPGVDVCVADLETQEILPAGKMGMLLVSGPTVFPGYLGYDGPSPFRDIAGRRWYVTGDLAEISEDGYITFVGRLKRFLKVGGEMVSLPALEEPFARLFPPTEDGPRVAVEGVETSDGGRIVLFTTESLSLRDANARLLEEGFRGVMRLDEVRRVDAIPLLGTGKKINEMRTKLAEESQTAAQRSRLFRFPT
jgi:long-chain-fatty-acid--[acyl-carrier-protein] ligase